MMAEPVDRTVPMRATAWALAAWALTSAATSLAYTHYEQQRDLAPDYPAVLAATERLGDMGRLFGLSEALTIFVAAIAAAWLGRRGGDRASQLTAWLAAACFAAVVGLWLLAWADVLPAGGGRWMGTPRLALLALGWLGTLDVAARSAHQRGARWAYGLAALATLLVLWRLGLAAAYASSGGPRMPEFRPWLWTGVRAAAQLGPAVLLVWLATRGRHQPAPTTTEPAVRYAWLGASWLALAAAVQLQQVFPSLRFPAATRLTLVAAAFGALALARAYQLGRPTDSRGSTDDDGAS